jgi:hypothetical protein
VAQRVAASDDVSQGGPVLALQTFEEGEPLFHLLQARR